ncbi:MAG: hypothetical protein LBH70_05195 [Spirochaetaceae bacterium]|jgi:hypothetical protein|nr:hypothetical protein [Spirochaetaceae bacterium]
MLGKLLRYEFKALLRIMPALYLALQAPALAAGINSLRLGFSPATTDILEQGRITSVLYTIWPMMFSALIVVNLALVILRFRDNFLKDEGYLMFTLPVPTWQLVASKATAALCTFLLTGIAGILSWLLFGLIIDPGNILKFTLLMFQQDLARWNGADYASLIIGAVISLTIIFQQLCLMYAAMTVSQLVPRFRSLAGFGVYLAVLFILEYPLTRAVLTLPMTGVPRLLVITLIEAAFAAFYLWCTSWLLKHTLNLE